MPHDSSDQYPWRDEDKNPGVSHAIAADEGALPTPAEGTGTTFSRFTAFTSPSRHTLIRPRSATSGGVWTTTTCRPLAAAFDTRPRSSTVEPTGNVSAGAAAAGAAAARGTRVVRLKRDRGAAAGAGARRLGPSPRMPIASRPWSPTRPRSPTRRRSARRRPPAAGSQAACRRRAAGTGPCPRPRPASSGRPRARRPGTRRRL